MGAKPRGGRSALGHGSSGSGISGDKTVKKPVRRVHCLLVFVAFAEVGCAREPLGPVGVSRPHAIPPGVNRSQPGDFASPWRRSRKTDPRGQRPSVLGARRPVRCRRVRERPCGAGLGCRSGHAGRSASGGGGLRSAQSWKPRSWDLRHEEARRGLAILDSCGCATPDADRPLLGMPSRRPSRQRLYVRTRSAQ